MQSISRDLADQRRNPMAPQGDIAKGPSDQIAQEGFLGRVPEDVESIAELML